MKNQMGSANWQGKGGNVNGKQGGPGTNSDLPLLDAEFGLQTNGARLDGEILVDQRRPRILKTPGKTFDVNIKEKKRLINIRIFHGKF